MKIDPALEPVGDQTMHKVACLLPPETRRKLWRELREGAAPVEARKDVMKDEPPTEAAAETAEASGEGRPAGTIEERDAT
jgi:peptide/nickel transport system ATP-binding protein